IAILCRCEKQCELNRYPENFSTGQNGRFSWKGRLFSEVKPDSIKPFFVYTGGLSQSWNGVYAKMTNGENHVFEQLESNIFVFNTLSGAGMTLSFGLAEHVIEKQKNCNARGVDPRGCFIVC